MPCEILHPVVRGTTVNSLALILITINLLVPCKLIFWKSYQSWQPSKISKVISQLWGIPQPQYFITLLLEAHWTNFWKYYIYYKKDTKVGSQNFGYQIWFCTILLRPQICVGRICHPFIPCAGSSWSGFNSHGPNDRNFHFDGLMQEKRNSIADALELRLSCIRTHRFHLQMHLAVDFCIVCTLEAIDWWCAWT